MQFSPVSSWSLLIRNFSNNFTFLHNCLQEACQVDEADFSLLDIFVGWGTGSDSNDLYQVHLALVPQGTCDQELRRYVNETMICAGDVENGGRDTCRVRKVESKDVMLQIMYNLWSSMSWTSVNPQMHAVNGNRVKWLVSSGLFFLSL